MRATRMTFRLRKKRQTIHYKCSAKFVSISRLDKAVDLLHKNGKGIEVDFQHVDHKSRDKVVIHLFALLLFFYTCLICYNKR